MTVSRGRRLPVWSVPDLTGWIWISALQLFQWMDGWVNWSHHKYRAIVLYMCVYQPRESALNKSVGASYQEYAKKLYFLFTTINLDNFTHLVLNWMICYFCGFCRQNHSSNYTTHWVITEIRLWIIYGLNVTEFESLPMNVYHHFTFRKYFEFSVLPE